MMSDNDLNIGISWVPSSADDTTAEQSNNFSMSCDDDPKRLGEPVHVVRCKDCRYYEEHHYERDGEPPYIKGKCGNKFGLNHQYMVHPEEFCSRGERK